jgi:uncharacterized protein YnzC (UPF0291/DUF896 family)
MDIRDKVKGQAGLKEEFDNLRKLAADLTKKKKEILVKEENQKIAELRREFFEFFKSGGYEIKIIDNNYLRAKFNDFIITLEKNQTSSFSFILSSNFNFEIILNNNTPTFNGREYPALREDEIVQEITKIKKEIEDLQRYLQLPEPAYSYEVKNMRQAEQPSQLHGKTYPNAKEMFQDFSNNWDI